MNASLKKKVPFFVLGATGFVLFKVGLALSTQSNEGPKSYENAMNGVAAFIAYCLPAEGSLNDSANMMQLAGGNHGIVAVDGREMQVIDSTTYGKGSVMFWAVGPVAICQVAVKSARENAEFLLLEFLDRTGEHVEAVALTSTQMARIPEPNDADGGYVTQAANSAGDILFTVSSVFTPEGDLTVFTASQESR